MVKRSWKSFLTGVALVGSMALSATAFAGGDGCTSCTSGGCCTGPNCHECEKIFADAGQKLTDQLASMSCCGQACCSDPSCCAPASVCDPGCGDPCGDPISDGCGEGCGEGCDGLFGESGSGITFGGWTQFGYQDGPDGAFTGNGQFNDVRFGAGSNPRGNEWDKLNLNQQGLYLNKTADGSNGVGFGFRAELIYGVDGNEAQAFGNPATPGNGSYDFFSGWDHGIYEWALPQLYAEVATGDLSVKLGHFYTPVGYEVIPSGGNFFLSRQLTFYHSEPFTHTGALGTYTAGDNLQVLGGWTLGLDTGFDRFQGGSSWLGGFIYTLSESTTLTYMSTVGNFGLRGDGAINSAILSQTWSDKWQTVHQFDILGTNGASDLGYDFGNATATADNSTGLINYAFYTINDKVKAGARQEWYKADGTSYNTVTYGVNVTPIEKLVIRPEVRHMWAPGATGAGGAGHDALFNETVFGVDAILTY
jgi:hypothetical protein